MRLLIIVSSLLFLVSTTDAQYTTIDNPYRTSAHLCTVRVEFSYPWISSQMAMCMDCENGVDIAILETIRFLRRG